MNNIGPTRIWTHSDGEPFTYIEPRRKRPISRTPAAYRTTVPKAVLKRPACGPRVMAAIEAAI